MTTQEPSNGDPTPTPPTDPTPTPTPAPGPPTPPAPVENNDDSLRETVNGLVTTVAGLVETVGKLVPRERDEAPTRVPWTHRGSRRRGAE